MNMHYRPGPRMSDVWTALENDTTLPPEKRRDLFSALRRLEVLTGKNLSDLPATVPALREAFETVRPLAHETSPKTLSNIKSLCLRALAVSEMVPGLVRDVAIGRPRLPEWAQIWEALPGRTEQNNLSRLVGFCNAHEILPEQVDTHVIEQMMAEMDQTSLRGNQYKVHRAAARSWNKVVDRHPERALQKVAVPPSRRRYCRVPLEDIPDSFLDDWNRFSAWAHGEDVFADDARPVRLKQDTLDFYWGMLHQAVSFLVESGVDPSSIQSIADLTKVEAFKQILRKHVEKTKESPNYQPQMMAGMLCRLARDWVKADDANLGELKQLSKRLPKAERKMTKKNKLLVMQFDDPDLRARFFKAPDRIWSQVQNGKKRGQYLLAEAQAGLAIQILTFMPLRIKNLTDLTFDQHIFLRPGGTSTLLIPEEEAKSGKGVEFDIPPALAERLIEYRHSIAARIIGRPPDRLFAKVDGSAKGTRVVRYLIERYMKLYVGIHMNPHVFRHLAAKFILDANPSAHVVVQHLLGHTNVQTTATFYAGMDTRRAGRHHQALLEASLAQAEEQAKAQGKSSKRRRGRRA